MRSLLVASAFALACCNPSGSRANTPDPLPVVSVEPEGDTEPEYVYRDVWTTRAPVGHTHTCGLGHTWDHAANPSHACAECGGVQYVQDRNPRMVTVRTRVRERVVTRAYRPDPLPVAVVRPYTAPLVPAAPAVKITESHTYSYMQGGCAGGQCDSGSTRRVGPLRSLLWWNR